MTVYAGYGRFDINARLDPMPEFSREEKLKEIAREIALRRNVYARRIRNHTMTVAEAEHGIAVMLEIAKDYGGHGDETA